ncbi:MAG: DUF1015 domain-containing protein [Candidatus Bipolaricaulota bacterium]
MAQVFPFRGVHYAERLLAELSNLVAPPYDRVPDDVQAALYARHPLNIVRITKGKAEPGDGATESLYARAARTLNQWLREGVLVQDPEPALYVYHQEYSFGGERLVRKGFMALAQLQPERVHAHEKTLKGPKEDRLRLMRATEANLEHVFMLYHDEDRRADRALGEAVSVLQPAMVAEDADKNAHRIWRVNDPQVIRDVQEALADKELYIADGHHRFETSVNYLRECAAAGWMTAATESFDKRLMTLFNVAEPGMTIRPIHRLVHGVPGFDVESFLDAAGERFLVSRFPTFEAMEAAARAGKDRHTFGMYARNVYATLTLRDEAAMDQLIPSEWSRDYKRLDVSILHSAILEPLLGIDARALEEQTHVTYSVTLEKGKKGIESGTEQAFFLLNPTGAEEVVRVADHGEKMPQKSTDFYPKLLTGLVAMKMQIRKP